MADQINNSATQTTESSEDKKYIRQLKELPPEMSEEMEQSDKKKVVQKESDNTDTQSREKPKPTHAKILREEKQNNQTDFEKDGEKVKLPLGFRDVILNVINMVSVVLLVVILYKLPAKAQELKKVRLQSLEGEVDLGIEQKNMSESTGKVETLKSYYLDESGIVNFVNDVERLRTEGGAIIGVTFAGQEGIKDKTDNYGVPVIIQMTGTWEQIAQDLQKIDQLPYLLRPIKVTSERQLEDPSVIDFSYGVLVYVKDELGKDR